jgi:phosphohistidine phosphatase
VELLNLQTVRDSAGYIFLFFGKSRKQKTLFTYSKIKRYKVSFVTTMKKLLLIRHAKATHESSYADFERPLKQSGKDDAELMASIIKGQSIIPQIIISSPALRTLTTAKIFAKHLQLPKVDTDKKIYEAGEQSWIKVINDLPNKYDFIGLVGHNPGISQALYYLTGQIRDMPTCAVALITLDNEDWQSISEEDGHLSFFDSPKG